MNFFKKKNVKQPVVIPDEKDDWIIFDSKNPPDDVVLAACDTHDCGWVMDTVWWNKQDETWMTTGSVISEPAHLEYSHYQYLPDPPK